MIGEGWVRLRRVFLFPVVDDVGDGFPDALSEFVCGFDKDDGVGVVVVDEVGALSEELGDLDVAECLEVVDGTAVADGKRLAEQRWLVLAVALCGVLFLERASGPADAAGGSGTHVVMVRIEDVDAHSRGRRRSAHPSRSPPRSRMANVSTRSTI